MSKLQGLIGAALLVVGAAVGFSFLTAASCGGPNPPPNPTPPPPLIPCDCVVPASDDPGWKNLSTSPLPYFAFAVKEAEAKIGDVCGKPPDASLDQLAAALVAANYCAAHWSDAVLIRRPGGDLNVDAKNLFEQYHATAAGTGCWVVGWTDVPPRAFIGTWQYSGSVPLSKCK